MTMRWFLFAVAVALPQVASAAKYDIDPAHTGVAFKVRHMMVSDVRGEFNKVSGSVEYDAKDPSKTAIDVSIDAASISTRVEMRDNDLRSASYLDVAKFPTITFKSSKAEKAGAGKLKV